MTIEDIRLGRLRVAVESTRANFAVSQVSSPANFLDMPYVEGTVQPQKMQDNLDPQSTQGYLDQYELDVLGKRSATLALTTHLSGSGVELNGTVAPLTASTWWMARILQTIMGGLNTSSSPGVNTQVQAGSTATVINVTVGHGVRFTAGGAIACIVNGRYECREVLSVATNAVSVKVAFSGTPANGTQVLGAYTFFLAEDPVDSLQFILEGRENADKWGFFGCQGGIGINVNTAELAQLTLNLTGADWSQLTPGAFVPGTLTNYNPVPVVDSEFVVGTVGSTTRTVINCQGQTWSPGITYTPIPSPTAPAQTLIGFRRTRQRSVSGSFNPYFDSSVTPDWYTASSTRANLALFQQIGSSVSGGGMALLSAPTVQIESAPQRADNGGLSAVTVNWKARHDAATAASSELQRSAFRIHLFR
jgi:hypothetical protein